MKQPYIHMQKTSSDYCVNQTKFRNIAEQNTRRQAQTVQNIGAGTGGAIIGGATSTSCSPNLFFCNLQLKVTLQTVRLHLTQKFSKTPQTPLYIAYTVFRKMHIAWSYILNLIALIVFHQFLYFCSLNWKIVPAPISVSNRQTDRETDNVRSLNGA